MQPDHSKHHLQGPAHPADPQSSFIGSHQSIKSSTCRGPLNLAPWLIVIPGELNPFQALLDCLGVPGSFSGEQYSAVLAAMAQHYGGDPLPASVLEQAISIVQVLLQRSAEAIQSPSCQHAVCRCCCADLQTQHHVSSC